MKLTTMLKVTASVAAVALLIGMILIRPVWPEVRVFAALYPILMVLAVMIGFRWGGQRAGPIGLLTGIAVAAIFFELTPSTLLASQIKGLVVSVLVLVILWPALMLYNLVDQAGGIAATARALRKLITDHGLLLIMLTWTFSAVLEGVAGFGIPIAIVAPMLVTLGVAPIAAVAAVAVGHAWSVAFGDMGIIFQTLVSVTNADPNAIVPYAALLLGVTCLLCGLAAMRILGLRGYAMMIVILTAVMSLTQYVVAASGLASMASLVAGLAGIGAGTVLVRLPAIRRTAAPPVEATDSLLAAADRAPLRAAVASYSALALLFAGVVLIAPLNQALNAVTWTITYLYGAQSFNQAIHPLTHPGMIVLVVTGLSYVIYRITGLLNQGDGRLALRKTSNAALPVTIGILTMVGLSTLMEYTGMTQLLAEALSSQLDRFFPLVSPLVGILGAFATGSNNNSNVLLGPLQNNVAHILSIAPALLLAAQTTGGAIGSMIAPAKIIVGCSTVNLKDRDGDVLRITMPYGLLIGLIIGVIALALA